MKMFYSINFSQLNKLDLAEIFEPVKQSYMENYEEKKVFTNVIGFGFFKNGNLERAVYHFTLSLEQDENEEAYFYLGLISNQSKKIREALSYFYKS